MAGQPLTRAREKAAMARAGAETTPKPPRQSRLARLGVIPETPAASLGKSDADLQMVLSGFAGTELDEATHAQFEQLRSLSLGFAIEIMEMPLDANNKNFAKIVSVKQAITTAMLTATVRVRPGDLRERDDDGVGALLDELKKNDRPLTAEEMLS